MVEFASGNFWAWSFLFGRFFPYKFSSFSRYRIIQVICFVVFPYCLLDVCGISNDVRLSILILVICAFSFFSYQSCYRSVSLIFQRTCIWFFNFYFSCFTFIDFCANLYTFLYCPDFVFNLLLFSFLMWSLGLILHLF